MSWLRRTLGSQARHTGAPPPPDVSGPQGYLIEVVEVIYSPSKRYREVIARDAAGLFRVSDERWDTADWEVVGAAYWAQYDRIATITDTLENARKLAREALALVEAPVHEQGDVEQ